MVIDQLITPKKLNQYANKFITAIAYRHIELNALFNPVTPAFCLFLITIDMENISETINITVNIIGNTILTLSFSFNNHPIM
jgi:hypothetical protein